MMRFIPSTIPYRRLRDEPHAGSTWTLRPTSGRRPPRRIPFLLAALALTIASTLAAGLPATAQAISTTSMASHRIRPALGPDGDAFYTPPDPLPAGRPGDVIRYRPLGTPPGTDPGLARSYLVMYLSRTATGRPTAITGTILVPVSSNTRTAPIVGVAPGTQGLGDQCAASKALAKGLLFSEYYLTNLLKRGWAVAMTDYEGLGTPGDHTYIVGRSAAHALIDVVRAAQRLPVAELAKSGPVAFYGYSEGGGASGWAGQLQPSYAPEMRLTGIAAGGVAADLYAVARSLDGSLAAGLLGYAAIGMDAAYPELKLDSYLTPFGRTAIAMQRTSCTFDGVSPYVFAPLSRFVDPDPLDTRAWQRRLTQNSLGRIAPTAPVFLWHGLVDEVLPFSQADALRKAWCDRGVRVTWRPFMAEHATGAIGSVDAIAFLGDRFAGRALPSDSC
jgi:fermentation-respiration switch protein FrsA (DUF1100 family)